MLFLLFFRATASLEFAEEYCWGKVVGQEHWVSDGIFYYLSTLAAVGPNRVSRSGLAISALQI